MTDPRKDPAGTSGQPGGTSQPGQTGQRPARHGLFHRGQSGRSSGSTTTSGASTGGTATATRQTTTGSTSVPQQAAQAPAERSAYGREQYGTRQYGQDYGTEASSGGALFAKAANMSWMMLMLGALGMLALGICLLVWPKASLFVVAILIGAALVVSGIVRLWEGFTSRDRTGGARAGYIVIGLLAILAGIYCLRHHALSVYLVAFVAGVYFVAHGIADLGASFSPEMSSRGLRAILGLFSIAAGLILVIWPGITLVLLLTITGAWLLFYGCVLGALAFGVRREAKAMTKAPRTAMAAPRAA
jgi:uncharacterized membrane protein HdeD (DUF308 family)